MILIDFDIYSIILDQFFFNLHLSYLHVCIMSTYNILLHVVFVHLLRNLHELESTFLLETSCTLYLKFGCKTVFSKIIGPDLQILCGTSNLTFTVSPGVRCCGLLHTLYMYMGPTKFQWD